MGPRLNKARKRSLLSLSAFSARMRCVMSTCETTAPTTLPPTSIMGAEDTSVTRRSPGWLKGSISTISLQTSPASERAKPHSWLFTR